MFARLLWVIGLVGAVLVLGSVTAGVAAQGPKPLGVQAALGSGFTYQGQLKQNGSPVNGTVSIAFKLYSAATGGSPLGTVNPSVNVVNGLFTTLLDFGKVFDGNERWLGISIASDAEMTPRQPITAAPYALYSTGNWGLNGNAGTNPSTNFLGTTDNQPLVFRTNNAEAMRLDNTGRLGIGTVGPNEQLEITGNFRLPVTTATTGIIKQGNATLIHSYGGNFFAGLNAGNLSMAGGGNTAGGNLALSHNSLGQSNTAGGNLALYNNEMGSYNTAGGYAALYNNERGSYNTDFGSYNTASGYFALFNNTKGSYNTAVGSDTGGLNTTGYFNTFLGFGANAASGNLINATAIGANATVATSNALVLGSNVNVGIGTSAPTRRLEVNGVVGVFDSGANSYNAGIATEASSRNLDIGINDDADNRFGGAYDSAQQGGFLRVETRNGYPLFGFFGRSALTTTNTTRLGYIDSNGTVRFELGTSQKFSLGGSGTFEIDSYGVGAGRFLVDNSGYVGIGHNRPTRILQLQQGGGHALGDGWDVYSSRRFKSNINTIENALDKVVQLRGVTFDWKQNSKHDIGLIAEEVGQVIPEVVKYEDNGVDAQSVDYSRLVALLIEATKQQQQQIEQQRASIETLRREKDSQLAELKQQSADSQTRLSALERTPSAGSAAAASGLSAEWLAIGALVLLNGLLLTLVLVHMRRGVRASSANSSLRRV